MALEITKQTIEVETCAGSASARLEKMASGSAKDAASRHKVKIRLRFMFVSSFRIDAAAGRSFLYMRRCGKTDRPVTI